MSVILNDLSFDPLIRYFPVLSNSTVLTAPLCTLNFFSSLLDSFDKLNMDISPK